MPLTGDPLVGAAAQFGPCSEPYGADGLWRKRGSPTYALVRRTLAEDHYRHALALAEELGMRPLQAHCHRSLGTLYAR